jgi:hypothetical protein
MTHLRNSVGLKKESMMNNRLPLRREARASTWSILGSALVCLVLFLGLITVGCGGGSSDTETTAAATSETTATTAAATSETTATTAAATELDAGELADAILATWTEAIQELGTLLEGLPEPSAVQSDVEALKEEYIQRFVELGTAKQALSDSDKASLDSKLSSQLTALGSEEFYTTYMANYDEYMYMSANVDFTNLLASFNVLTQYADFTLLKSQLPDEAARLGIE